MNTAKIAAALHALADAFLEGGEEQAKPAKGGKKTATAEQPAQTPTATPTPTPVVEQTPAPIAPSVTIAQVNKVVLAVAAKSRDRAVAILGSLGLTNTVGLAPEKFQAVYDAFEEEIAKQDAAAVHVAQASLV
jgi:hypothetical protein